MKKKMYIFQMDINRDILTYHFGIIENDPYRIRIFIIIQNIKVTINGRFNSRRSYNIITVLLSTFNDCGKSSLYYGDVEAIIMEEGDQKDL